MSARKAGGKLPEIVRYGRLREVRVYEISEAELEKLENGPPGQLHLSFALALLPAALTMLITLQTVEIRDNRIYLGYLIAFWVFAVQGTISLIRWWTSGTTLKALGREIRSRMPEEPVVAVQESPAAPMPEIDAGKQ